VTPEAFAEAANVSRETLARFEAYADLLTRWQKKINLVSDSTLKDLWQRHFLDSAQIFDLASEPRNSWLDLGSGAGFPGLVLSLLGADPLTLVESDSRKAAFLAEAARVAGAKPKIVNRRIEALEPWPVDIITARAFVPLSRLLDLSKAFITPSTSLLLLKGQDVEAELTEASKSWSMQIERFPSRSDPRGVILRLRGLRHGPAHRQNGEPGTGGAS
jgi:16S rRNA (guanine527-N7)-methyltransferase